MTKNKTDAQKREALRTKIDAGEVRNSQRSFAEQAREAADDALDYVKAHPLKSVAAVTVAALLIGAMTRPGRRAGRKAGAMASVAADAALAYGLGLLDSAGDVMAKGQDRLSEFGDTAETKARKWGGIAARETGELSDYLATATRRGGKRASRTIDELRGRLGR